MISVIIPIFNSEPYLNDLIDSLEKQVYKDFEVIFIDDGSKDGSIRIIENFQGETSLVIKFIKQKNRGPSAARNKGIENSNGELICFVDSDDVLSPLYLSQLINNFYKFNADIVICKHRAFTDEKMIKIFDNNLTDSPIITTKEELMNGFLFNTTKIGITLFLIRKQLLDTYKIRFNENYKHSEDTEFIWKVINHVDIIVLSSSILYHYRVRKNSLTTNFSEQNIRGIELIDNLNNYIEKNTPSFGNKFKKYAGANARIYKLKEAAVGSSSYSHFKNFGELMEAKNYISHLFTFPLLKVKLMSILYCISPYIFYLVIRVFYKKL